MTDYQSLCVAALFVIGINKATEPLMLQDCTDSETSSMVGYDRLSFSPSDSDSDPQDPIDVEPDGPDPHEDGSESEPGEQPERAVPIDVNFFANPGLNRMALKFLRKYTKRNMTRAQGVDVWKLLQEYSPYSAVEMKSFDTLERRLAAVLPSPVVSWKVLDLETGESHVGAGKCFPERLYGNRNKFEISCTWSRLKLKDVIRLHAGIHVEECEFVEDGLINFTAVHITFTCDGIPYAHSTPENLHVIALKFRDCREVYIVQARVAKRSEPKNVHDFIDAFVAECNELEVHVDFFVADSPMRSFFKMLKGHAGRSSCEICEAVGTCVSRRIVYPAHTVLQQKRSQERWLEFVEDLESQSGSDNVHGIMGRSPLLTLNNFDIVRKSPTDPLHRDWLGITKSTLWRNTTGMGKNGIMNARGQRIANSVSDFYRALRLPSEFSHRSRPVDYPNFKGHEWKSLLISSFVAICDVTTLECDHKMSHVWLLYTFLILLYNGPRWAFDEMDDEYLEELHQQLYDEFEEVFGPGCCTFNWHSFYHMPTVRKFGSMPETSTEPFESAYGKVSKSFRPGTRNAASQIIKNMTLRSLNHGQSACEKRLVIEPETCSLRTDDSIVMDDLFHYYKVLLVQNDHVKVAEIKKTAWDSPFDPTLPYHKVGIFQKVSISEDCCWYRKDYFTGKGMIVKDNILIPMHRDLLFS